jgi:hypothetical protein
MEMEKPVNLTAYAMWEQQEHILAAQERFCQVHRLIIYTDTKARIRVHPLGADLDEKTSQPPCI